MHRPTIIVCRDSMIIHACNYALLSLVSQGSTRLYYILSTWVWTHFRSGSGLQASSPRYAHEPRTYTADQRAVDGWVDGKLIAEVYWPTCQPIPGLGVARVHTSLA